MRKKLLLMAFFAAATLFAQEPAEHKTEAQQSEEPAAIWRWANFVILAAGVVFLMTKHLPGHFSSNKKEIQKGISEAQQMKADAEKRSAEMDARLKALGADIEKFRTQSAAEMQQEGERISRETAAQIKKIEQQATVEIESVGKTARRQLKEYAAELAVGLAEERLRSRMDGATESLLVDGFVHDLERQASQITSKTGSKN